MKELKKAQMGIIAILTVMLVSITRRLPTRRLSSGITTTLALAGIVLLVAAGTVSAEFACVANDPSGDAYFCGDTVLKSCTLNGSMSCTNAAQNGLIIGASGITINGAGYKMTGYVSDATCTGSQTSPCVTHSGIVNDGGWDNVVVEDLEIENFCTGVVIGTEGVTVEYMNVTGCKIHDCGKSTATTHGIHLAGANYCGMTKNEIYNIDGTGIDAGCGGGGNGIFMHGVTGTGDGGDYNTITCNYLHNTNKSGFFSKYKCAHCDISHNNASDNPEGGIVPMCKFSNYNTIEYNIMSNNGRCGVETQASHNILRYNTIRNNGWYGIWIKTEDCPAPIHGINNDVFNNTLCGNSFDIKVSNGDGSNDADSNTCDASTIGGCDWSCGNLVSVYYDYDGDAHYSAASCSCGNILSVGACCNPGLFNDTGASTHCDGGVCVLSAGDDPNDCDPGAPAAQPYYCDDDADGYFSADSSGTGTELPTPPPACRWEMGDDCNDANPDVNPGAAENCTDGIDNDCDGLTDGEDPDCFPDQVYLVPQHSGASYCNTTIVEVYADTTTMIQGGSINLSYTSGCANVTDVEYDPMWDLTDTWGSGTDGYEWLSFAMKSTDGVNGTVHICDLTIHCECVVYCTTPLHFISKAENPTQYCLLSNTTGGKVSDVGWQDGTFTCTNLPDLVITKLYGIQQGTGNDYVVNCTVTNEGNAPAALGHNATLHIGEADDLGNWTRIANMTVLAPLAPGDSYTGTFATVLTMTIPNDLMKVCADTGGDVMEINETNNCMESFYPAGIEIKVDVLDDGECVDFQEQFLVNITVDPRNIPVYGVQYTLSFNNEVLHAEWQNEGDFLNQDSAPTNVYINNINNGAGTISFAATRVGDVGGVTAAGTLAVIKFTAIQQGESSNLTLSGVVAANNIGGKILPLDLINDSVCVFSNYAPVAIGKSMFLRSNDGQKYLSTAYFNGSGSYDPDGAVIYWRWSFGDGEYGTGEMKDHIYRSWNWNGSGYDPFTVSLTVTDDGDPHELDNTTYFDVMVYTAGDTNGDGEVDILDATIVGLEWDHTAEFNGALYWYNNLRGDMADLNNDGIVDILDAVIVGTCWGHTAW